MRDVERGVVTVMVPSYNYAEYLTECVESAAAQCDVDVVVVDNGSTDESPEIGHHLAEIHDNVRFIRHLDNQGIIASFNRCLNEVRGEFVSLLCADDCLTPGSISRSLDVLRARPEVGMVYGPATVFERLDAVDVAALVSAPPTPAVVHPGHAWVDALCRSGMNPVRAPEMVVRRSALDHVGGFEPRCPHTSDLNLWLRLATVTDAAYLPGPSQALYRVHGRMHSGNFPYFSSVDLEQRWAAFSTFLETVTDSDLRFRWETMVRNRLGAEARYAATRMFVATDQPSRVEDVERLREFAARVDPGGGSPAEALGWRLRDVLGHQRSRWWPGFLPRALAHRYAHERSMRRRDRIGLH
jgi:glycosyltransferase involved in cell wall biosynthesis